MDSNITQLKVTIPDRLYDYLNSRASKYGITVSLYVKNLILDDVKDMEYPVFVMSDRTESNGLQALDDYRKGNTAQVDDVDEFFQAL